MGTQLHTRTHTHTRAGDFFKSGRASESPSRAAGDAPSGAAIGWASPRRQGQGPWSCSGVQWCTPVLRPDWPRPRGEAARVASGPDCRPRGTTCIRASSQLSLSLSAPAPSPPQMAAHTRRVGWHDGNQLRRLDARGDGARPDGALPTATAPRTGPVTGWLSSPVPCVARILPMRVGEKR